jgi:hypothetical protein
MMIDMRPVLTRNTAQVHLTSAVMHAQGLLPKSIEPQNPDLASTVFHLCQACILGNKIAALTIGRLLYGTSDLNFATEIDLAYVKVSSFPGLGTSISDSAQEVVQVDAEKALIFYELASQRGSVLASWLLAQWHLQQGNESDALKFLFRCHFLHKQEDMDANSQPASSCDESNAEIPSFVTKTTIDMTDNPLCFVVFTPADEVRHSIDFKLRASSLDDLETDAASASSTTSPGSSFTPNGSASPVTRRIRYHVGDEVLASTSGDLGNTKYYLAKIVRIHTDHSVIVSYIDDHSEEEVSLDRLKPASDGVGGCFMSQVPFSQAVHQQRSDTCEQDFELDVAGGNHRVELAPQLALQAPKSHHEDPVDPSSSGVSDAQSPYTASPHTIFSDPPTATSASAVSKQSIEAQIPGDEYSSRPADYEIGAALAELLVKRGLESDQLLAYELYLSASDACAALGKGKQAAKFAELAESF